MRTVQAPLSIGTVGITFALDDTRGGGLTGAAGVAKLTWAAIGCHFTGVASRLNTQPFDEPFAIGTRRFG